MITTQNSNRQSWYPAVLIPFLTGVMLTVFSCTKQEKEELSSLKNATQQTENSEELVKDVDALDTSPEFQSGNMDLATYFRNEVNYPEAAVKAEKSGRAIVSFTVNETGEVLDPRIKVSSGHESLDDEALRVISEMPEWQPGKKEGKAVKVGTNLPVHFQLNDREG